MLQIAGSQRMEIHDLTSSQGLLSLKLGNAKIINDYTKLIHIVNLTIYEENIDIIEYNIKRLQHEITTLPFSLNIQIVHSKFENLKEKLRLLLPHKIVKRGLINGLGTIIKTITGNMDHNDAVEINRQIEMLKLNQHDLNNALTEQLSINHEMTKRFNNITNHINKQQVVIEKYFDHFRNELLNKVNFAEAQVMYNQYIDKITYNIDLLTIHLKEISESIVLAKLNVIPKQILHPSELKQIYQYFNNHNIDLVSSEHIYELLELQAYYNQTNIIFVVLIPNFLNEQFHYYHIRNLPINNTYTIKIPDPYIVLNEISYQYMTKPCNLIENQYFCENKHLKSSENEHCITKLIQKSTANCSLIETEDIEFIETIEENYLLIATQHPQEIQTTCEMKRKNIIGNLLIHFQNCSIEINNVKYTSKSTLSWDDVFIIPTVFSQLQVRNITKTLTLQKLNDFHQKTRKAIELLEVRENKMNYSTYTIIGIIVTIIIITIIIRRRCNTKNEETENENFTPISNNGSTSPKIQFHWPMRQTLAGGVII